MLKRLVPFVLPSLLGCTDILAPRPVARCDNDCTAVLESYAGRDLPTRIQDNNDPLARTIMTAAETLFIGNGRYERHTTYTALPLIASVINYGQTKVNNDSLFLYHHDSLVQRGIEKDGLFLLRDGTDTSAVYRIKD